MFKNLFLKRPNKKKHLAPFDENYDLSISSVGPNLQQLSMTRQMFLQYSFSDNELHVL
jgi:hypothetical protein